MDDEMKKLEKDAYQIREVRKIFNRNVKKISSAIKKFFTEIFDQVHEIPLSLRIICGYLNEFTEEKITEEG